MTRIAQDVAIRAGLTARSPRPGLWDRLCRHVASIDAAQARQARFNALTGEVSRDTGLPPETILGESPHDPALPFFFRHGFGRD